METVADFEKWVEIMRSELKEQVIAVKILAVAFAECNVQLFRHDQVAHLRVFKFEIMEEVENIKRLESAARIGSNNAALLISGAAFAIGSVRRLLGVRSTARA